MFAPMNCFIADFSFPLVFILSAAVFECSKCYCTFMLIVYFLYSGNWKEAKNALYDVLYLDMLALQTKHFALLIMFQNVP